MTADGYECHAGVSDEDEDTKALVHKTPTAHNKPTSAPPLLAIASGVAPTNLEVWPDFSDLVAVTLTQKKATNRGAFTTKAYKNTITRAKWLGITGAAALVHAREAPTQAAASWDALA